MQKEWFSSWFDTTYYHTLYKHRDYSEASSFIDHITGLLKLTNKSVNVGIYAVVKVVIVFI
jgi:hypothetical protein